MSCICAAPVASARSAANPKFAQVCGALGCELRVQKRHYKHRFASVLIDSEVRTSVPQMLTNFGIGTLAIGKHEMKNTLLAAVTLIAATALPAILQKAMIQKAMAQDVEKGQRSFNKSLPCHAISPGAENKVGPALNGIDGRQAA